MNYGKNTGGLYGQALAAEYYYASQQGRNTYDGSMLALGIDKEKVYPDLLAQIERCGERGQYYIYLNMNSNAPASAVVDQIKNVLEGRIGMTYVPGPDWQGEPYGYRQSVGYLTLIALSRLGAMKQIYPQR